MLELRWHRVSLACPKCDTQPGITNLSSSSDGEIRLGLICVRCGIELQWISTTAKLIATALYADIEEAMAQSSPKRKPNLPIRAPLTNTEVKRKDAEFLHNLGIQGGGVD